VKEAFAEQPEQEHDALLRLREEVRSLRSPEASGSLAVVSLAAWRDRLHAEFVTDPERLKQSILEARAVMNEVENALPPQLADELDAKYPR
jgi:hypothetical protein